MYCSSKRNLFCWKRFRNKWWTDSYKIYKTYLCGSELHYYRGEFPEYISLPKCIGHEGAGEVVEVGKKVSKFNVGNKVIDSDVLIGQA